MKLRCYDIRWDTDGQGVDLPTETTLDVSEDFDADNETADALSDKFGWCVSSVGVEVL